MFFHFIYGIIHQPLMFTPSFFKMVKLHHQPVIHHNYPSSLWKITIFNGVILPAIWGYCTTNQQSYIKRKKSWCFPTELSWVPRCHVSGRSMPFGVARDRKSFGVKWGLQLAIWRETGAPGWLVVDPNKVRKDIPSGKLT